jgi:hypothetical protein
MQRITLAKCKLCSYSSSQLILLRFFSLNANIFFLSQSFVHVIVFTLITPYQWRLLFE